MRWEEEGKRKSRRQNTSDPSGHGGMHSAKAEFVSKRSSKQVAEQNQGMLNALLQSWGFLLKARLLGL